MELERILPKWKLDLIVIPNSFWGWPAPPEEELAVRLVNVRQVQAWSASRDGLVRVEFADGRTLHSTTLRLVDLGLLTA